MSLLYSPTSLEKGLKTKFLEYFSTENSLADQLCFVETSASDSEKYEWLGQAPQMSELMGERKITPLSDTGYTLTNTTYEATIAVKRNHLEDGQTGSINRRIQQMAQTASVHVNKLVIDALVNGTTDTCYDGTAFFGNSHTARGDGAAFDNLEGGSGTTTSAIAADLATAKKTMLRFQDEAGEPFHADSPSQFTVVAPPELEKNMREVLGASMISNTSNMQVGAANLIISTRLSDVDNWYFLRTDNLARGLLFQQRSPIEFSALESNTESSFLREVFYYGVRARYAVSYAFPQSAVKMVNSG